MRYNGLFDDAVTTCRKNTEFVVAAAFYLCHFMRKNKVPRIDDFLG